MLTDITNSYGVIYTITNLVNGKVYVGQTTTPNLRYKQHLQENSKRPITSALKKYGANNCVYQIIDHADDQGALDFLEQVHINRLNAHVSKGGYNLTFGGSGCAGHIRSDEDKQRKREAAYRRWNSPRGLKERKVRSKGFKGPNNPMYGKSSWNKGKTGVYSNNTKERMSVSAKLRPSNRIGAILSDATRRKISETKRRKLP